jgi:hypothetical protein
MEEVVHAAGRYSQLLIERNQFLDRARDAAKYTIPTLVPPDNAGPSTKYYTPYQGLGARGVNNLSAKLLLALLPPNSPFFRLQIDDFTLMEISQQEGARGEFEQAINRVERSVMTHLETNRIRTSVHEALKYLVVAGNVLLHFPSGEGVRVFRLDRYVVLRDPMGNVLEIITKESIAPAVLPEGLKEKAEEEIKRSASTDKTVDLYTWVRREKDQWTVHQEVAGETVPDSEGTYPLEHCPWIPLRWTKIDGESYGRGYVEEYLGDLRSLEGLTKAIVIGSSAAAKVLFFVNPNGSTKVAVVSKAESGDVVPGNAEDVSTLQMEKRADFSTAQQVMDMISQRLAQAFMMNTAVQRDAERVTAEEIRYVAQELEDALGGVYSILSQEFQLPLVRILMNDMETQGLLPPLPKEIVQPVITTGLEALGRGHDLQKLETFKRLIMDLGPEIAMRYINVGEYFKRTGASLGIDMDGLIKSDEEIAQEEQQAQMQQMIQHLGPNAINSIPKMMEQAQGNVPQAS